VSPARAAVAAHEESAKQSPCFLEAHVGK